MMGDLSFGAPFGCLENGRDHGWVKLIFQSVKGYPWFQALIYYNLLPLAGLLTPKDLADAKIDADRYAFEKVEQRLVETSTNRKDFISYIHRKEDSDTTSKLEIQETAAILIIAGSETSATCLSAAIYLMLKNPHVHERVVAEVRNLFTDYDEITMVKTNELRYLHAIINETLRIYPPAPLTFPRVVPGQGEQVQGNFVPPGTTVGVPQFAACRDPKNFYRPDDFLPERWLKGLKEYTGDVPAAMFTNDQQAVSQPFSTGPRNCIGRS